MHTRQHFYHPSPVHLTHAEIYDPPPCVVLGTKSRAGSVTKLHPSTSFPNFLNWHIQMNRPKILLALFLGWFDPDANFGLINSVKSRGHLGPSVILGKAFWGGERGFGPWLYHQLLLVTLNKLLPLWLSFNICNNEDVGLDQLPGCASLRKARRLPPPPPALECPQLLKGGLETGGQVQGGEAQGTQLKVNFRGAENKLFFFFFPFQKYVYI